MKELKIKIELLDEMLGTAAADPDVYRNYIASKGPDAKSIEEEVKALGTDEVVENKMTVFPKMADGTPFMWDYQLKGFFKDACSALQRCKGSDISKESCKLKAFKKIIDGCIFVYPRQIPINLNGLRMGVCERPLRAATAQGERVALASSETVPEGSTMEAKIVCLGDEYEAAVKEWLNYGQFKGLLQWRNSGKGRFKWEEI